MAKHITDAVLAAQNIVLADGSDIRISEFDIARLGNIQVKIDLEIPRAVVDEITATKNRESMIIGNSKGAIILVLQSRQDDQTLKYVFDILSDSAKRQFTKNKPAIFIVGFNGINSEVLLDIANQDSDPKQSPTALRIAVSDFLASKNRDHVVGVGFLSNSTLKPGLHGVIENGGTAYMFPKKESKYWHDDFSGLFS